MSDTGVSPALHPVGWLKQWLQDVTAGDLIFPLAILFAIYFFDEFDTAAFGVLAPKIKDAFDLTNQEFLGLIAANLNVVLLCAIPLGHYGDRLPRRKIVFAGAIVAGVFSFATGLAPGVIALLLFRIGNGIGVLVNDPIHRSLLSDYYTAEARPTVFATHANAVRWGAIVGSGVAGLVGYLFGWEAAFMILIVPIVIVAFISLRLPPVFRGQSDDPDSAALAAEERAVPFARSARILWSVRTLRREYIAWIFIGAGFLPLAGFIPIYLDDVFHLNSLEVGVLVAVGNGFGLVGVQIAGRMTRKWLASGLGEPLKYAGLSLAAVGPCLLIAAVAPNLAIAVIAIVAAYFVGGIFAPPFYTVQALVSPARVRSLSFGFGLMFLVLGLDGFSVFFGGMANDSIRVGIALLAPFWVIGGLVLLSARAFVTIDATRALSTLTTTVALRREREEAGARSLLVCRNVDVAYGQTQVLFGVNFDVKQGDIVALLGTNGAGKSTLLKAIAGSVQPTGGAIFYDGEDISGLGAPAVTAAGVSLVPGGKGVFPGLSVAENLALAGWLLRKDDEYIQRALSDALGFFPVLRERWDQKAGNLSGGEQQMLTIAMALLARPKLLMIDELSLGLAPLVVERLLDVVRDINGSGITIVLVEQSVNVALTLAQRAVFMEKGEVRFDGPTAELLERPDILRSVFLEGAAAAVGAPEQGLVGGDVDSDGHGDGARTDGGASATGRNGGNGGQRGHQLQPSQLKPFEIPTDRKGRARPPVLTV